MNDETYAFIQDVRERKITARGARHKVSGSRSKKCTLSQDTLTPAQLKRRNGPVSTYAMNAPHTWKELKTWSPQLRKEYMSELLDKYDPTNVELSEMLGVSKDYVSAVVSECGVKRGRGGKHTRSSGHDAMWYDFISGGEPILPDDYEPAPEEPKTSVKLMPISYEEVQLTFTGTVTDLVQCIVTGPLHLFGADTCTFTVKATRK